MLNDKSTATWLDHVHMEKERILKIKRYVFERELLGAGDLRILVP